ncbi:bifunctional PH-like domain superfamily/Protein ICln-Lot5-Saf5 [Babesia duncani]|uniref:Bifunctional PH-like domain superfamily/Protein ICln-Lot5-Saf5 n=1 Tax=Babesia duncani TaxID=323732 RepID=A0AAD9PKM6_9APIC|nr:bifunctional PH-like domain superfamily/Protein ICln-Lot5-Saf5 [Babesia duncani]
MQHFGGYERNPARDADNKPLLHSAGDEHIHKIFHDIVMIFEDKEYGMINIKNGVDKYIDAGVLYITTRRVIWLSRDDTNASLGFPYTEMVLHAISRDKGLYKNPCLLVQLNGTTDEEDEENSTIPTVLFSTEEYAILEKMFNDITDMNSLNCHPESPSDDEYNDGDEVDIIMQN